MNVWSIQDHLGFSGSFDAFLHIIVLFFSPHQIHPDQVLSDPEITQPILGEYTSLSSIFNFF